MSEKTTIRVNGRVIDLVNSLPLSLGDWEALEAVGCVEGVRWNLMHAKQSIDFIHTLAVKQDPGITRDMIKAIPLNEMPILTQVTAKVNGDTPEDGEVAPAVNPTT